MLESYNSQDLWLRMTETQHKLAYSNKRIHCHTKKSKGGCLQIWLDPRVQQCALPAPPFLILIGFLPSKDGQVTWSLLGAPAAIS